MMDYEYFIDTMDTTPLVVEPDNQKKVIVGVSVKQEGIDFIGQHSFIMFIDENSPKKSIMLDASGHYGEGRSSDVIDGYQMPITISSYLKYWDSLEYLYTFELNIKNSDEEKIKQLITEIEGRHWLACTDRASSLLLETGLFNGLKHRQLPKKFLKDLIKYSKAHPGSMIIKKFDMKTDTEIPYEE